MNKAEIAYTPLRQMEFTKEEVQFLNDNFNDIYYALNVEDMTKEGQALFFGIQEKFSKEARK